MGHIYDNLTQFIGKTPLVRLSKIAAGSQAELLGKLEMYNPAGSIKDRIAFAMIDDAEKRGKIKPGDFIVEPTSGNTGIGLACVCAIRGYRLILTMPESMSRERKLLLLHFGAEIVFTNPDAGMKGAIDKAIEIAERTKAFMPQQFKNPANPEIHKKTTAIEIWNDTEGRVDIIVSGIGSGGTVTGIAEALKKKKPSVKIIGIEPEGSAVISGRNQGTHKIQGIGAGFIPEVLNLKLIDEIMTVSDDDAITMAKRLSREEGILAGISSGASVWAASKLAGKSENKSKVIVAVLPDTGERYLNTELFENEEKDTAAK